MKAYHSLVAGDSGSGKTTLLREIHKSAEWSDGGFPGLSIWINHTDTSGVAGVRASGSTAMQNASRPVINYQTTSDNLIAACEDVRKFAISYFEATGHPTQVILDECQEVLSEEIPAEHPLAWMLHQGRDKGIKVLLATQDPSDLQPSYSRIKQCRLFAVVGQLSVWHDGFIRYFSLPRDELPDDEFKYVVFDKRMEVEYRGETKKKYG